MKATTYLSLLFCCFAAWAQASLEVIDLRHTTAEQVLQALRPLLEPGGVLTGQRSQLIVRTSPANLVELRRALETLDAPARRLVIAVRFAGESAIERTEASVGVRGSRIKNIVDELNGEKIDIVRWNESSQILIQNALKPAEVAEISLCFELGRATVVVGDDPLSLAMRGLIDNASSQEHQIAMLWQAIGTLAEGRAQGDCVPSDACRDGDFKADKLNELVGK